MSDEATPSDRGTQQGGDSIAQGQHHTSQDCGDGTVTYTAPHSTKQITPTEATNLEDRCSGAVPAGPSGKTQREVIPRQISSWSAHDIDGGVGRSDLEGEGEGNHLETSMYNKVYGAIEQAVGKVAGNQEVEERGEERKHGLR